MVLPPAVREQITHKVLQCFSLLFKEIFKYFNGTLFNAWRQWQRLENASQWNRDGGCKSSLCIQTTSTCITVCKAISTSQL